MKNLHKPLPTKLMFMPNGLDKEYSIINGDITNLLDLSNVPKKSEIFHTLVDKGYANNWLPQKTEMSSDAFDYKKKLTDKEVLAYDNIISFLTFLDSLQTNNLPNISKYITNPHIVYWIARQTYEEANHSKSYGWILNSVVNLQQAHQIVYKWRENKILFERNKFIANLYDEFVATPTPYTFIKVLMANYMLEGLYFYNGFQFFHNLASRGLMMGTDTQISYIQRDEELHCVAFKNIIKQFFEENPQYFNDEIKELLYSMMKTATEQEIQFSSDAIGDNVLGMSIESIINYSRYLANLRLKHIGLNKLFDSDCNNPYKHLETMAASADETTNRTNNFEGTSITYKAPEAIDGWEDL